MRTLLLSLCLCTALSAARAQATTAGDVKREAKQAADTTSRFVGEKKDAFEARMKDKLAQLSTQMGELKKKAESGTEDVKKKARAELDALEPKKREVEAKLSELKSSGADAWQKLKAGVEGAVNELERGVQRARK